MIFKFKEKKWWKNTKDKVQTKIEELCTTHSLVADYFNSMNDETEKEILNINSLLETDQFAIVKVEHRINTTNQIVYKEFILNKKQNSTGGRCLISINNGLKRQIIIYKNESMLTFFPDFSKNNLCQFPQSFVRKLNIILKNKQWTVSKITDLGTITPISDISPDKVPIFWVDIRCDESIDQPPFDNEIQIYDYDKLISISSKTNDSVALSIIVRKYKLDQNEKRND